MILNRLFVHILGLDSDIHQLSASYNGNNKKFICHIFSALANDQIQ